MVATRKQRVGVVSRSAPAHCSASIGYTITRDAISGVLSACAVWALGNTLLMQQALADPKWADMLTDADRRALSPRFWTHVNPYGSNWT
ncbi:hypothetical protein GCM10010446_33390 [Streptomyces enissocaesilis]|uniref:Tn3 transposase DDE domain-containing protein n=1 Tax=Streptomyces enissocaesilis TaxID=332589 RepID=A0ABN3XBS8_9ACTN